MSWLFGKSPSKRANGSLPAVLLDEGQSQSMQGNDRGRKSVEGRRRVPTLDTADSGSYMKPTSPMSKTKGGKSKASTLHAVGECPEKDAKGQPRSKTHEGQLEDILVDLPKGPAPRGATDLSVDESAKTRPSSSSAALSTSLLAKVLRRSTKGDEVEKIADEVADVKAERTEKADAATELQAKDPAASQARLLLDDGMKAAMEDGDAVSKQLQRRQEALLRSKKLKEMMCTSPAMTKMPSEKVDIKDMPGQQQSSEDIYWQSLWNATKDLMHEGAEEDRGADFDGLLPTVPGSVELPML